jgi:hypothetical protein
MVESAVSLGRVDEFVGDLSGADQHYRQALEWARRMDPGPSLLQALIKSAHLRMLQGEDSHVGGLLDEAWTVASSIPDTLEYGPTLRVRAEWSMRQGDLEEAASLAGQALAAPTPLEETLATNIVLANIEAALSKPAPARSYAEEALRIAELLESPHWRNSAHIALAAAKSLD